ncbi:aspartyl-phosphate phosphatase Spo0E family protein [Bacillus sp. SG-1]|uniref:aspartyl-phosphate phosphatase Spo0E family protein n=1 Tax=Bacillus sp. SG-1 TaxID=161544 RepID=UPI0009FFD624|nr:aspartyl-phosphate phosphatase Spo0E family protein [Bacillus sp. SG-1]
MKECEIHRQIEETRTRMFRCAAQYGLNSEKTIKISQELDRLINFIQRQNANKEQINC